MRLGFINILRFSLQLLCCEAFFFSVLPRRKGWQWRVGVALGAFLLGDALVQGLWSLAITVVPESFHLVLYHLYFLLPFVNSLFCAAFVHKAEPWAYVSAGVGGYAAQHTAYCVTAIVRYLIPGSTDLPVFLDYLLWRTLPYLLCATVFYFWLIKPSVHNGVQQRATPQRILLSSVILFSCELLSTYVNMHAVGAMAAVCRVYAAFSCTLAIYIQYLYSDQERLEWEKNEMERLLHVSQQQTKMSAEAVEVINLKYHDLKHLLSQLRSRMDHSDTESLFQEITNAIDVYDSMTKTGSDALDVVLTQKALLCEGYHIPFDFPCNGEKLSFMSATDVASLFGNAMDNAIESQLREEESKRFINMQIKSTGNILLIHVDNYCTHVPVFHNGMPETIKEDKTYNGFGVKSIQYIANKYGGQMRVNIEDDTFHLDVMIPMSEAK